ncbi:MAG TPA: c-type cytochrome [Thermoanaerobaculia bacterium]|jgi:cytochrome c2|nr:c-type cytochrome [Thermoanaerobaculia bacterium]
MKRVILTVAILLAACANREESIGNADRGKQLIEQYGCQSCHVVPGVKGPKGVVGPSLDKMAVRTFIGGKVQNTSQNMTQWLQNPQAFDPGNAMPNLGVTPVDARDITAYLFTLK